MNKTSLADRLNGLRAGVLGANDGIVSVAALIIGVAAAHSTRGVVFTAGMSALLAGAVSMGLGEYVSVSTQRDAEKGLVKTGQMPAEDMVRPWLAARSSAVAFTVGAAIPLVAMLCSPLEQRIPITFAAVLAALVLTGVVSARMGDTPILRPTVRVVAGGAVAMAVTYLIGYLTA